MSNGFLSPGFPFLICKVGLTTIRCTVPLRVNGLQYAKPGTGPKRKLVSLCLKALCSSVLSHTVLRNFSILRGAKEPRLRTPFPHKSRQAPVTRAFCSSFTHPGCCWFISGLPTPAPSGQHRNGSIPNMPLDLGKQTTFQSLQSTFWDRVDWVWDNKDSGISGAKEAL